MDEAKYVFAVELYDGQELRWTNLTQHQAKCMYKWVGQLQQNYKAAGWEEMK